MNVYIRVPSTILDFEIPTFLYLLQRSPEFPASNEKIPPLKKQLVQRKWKLISDVSNKFNKPDAKRKSIAVERYRVLLVILMTAVCLRAGGAISVSITRRGEWRVASGVRRVACGGWRGVSRVTCYSDTLKCEKFRGSFRDHYWCLDTAREDCCDCKLMSCVLLL